MKSVAWKSRRWHEGLFAYIWEEGFCLHSGSIAWKEMLGAFFKRSPRVVKRSQDESTVDRTVSFTESLISDGDNLFDENEERKQ